MFNSAYNKLQFWDGRATSLEDQSQGPVGNALEMFGGKADAVGARRSRGCAPDPDYVKQFARSSATPPTRDAAAKAIATYERTVLLGNGVHDRAEVAMRKRVVEEETGKFELKAEDYAAGLKDEFAAKDVRR